MNERLMQFLWQFQRLRNSDLTTTCGQHLEIIYAGQANTNQGPDFLNGRLRIGDTTWVGNIELHVKSSDWALHKHSSDKNYENIILHVVWQHDSDLSLDFPTLEIQQYVPKILLERFDLLMTNQDFIPCSARIAGIDPLVWLKWKESLLIERIQEKVSEISASLQLNKGHWEEAFWWLLARNFGARTNMEAFEKLARSIPLNLLAKHKNQLLQLEALLFGQAGLLTKKFADPYPLMLSKEYQFLRKKYRLKPIDFPIYFLRMRPANFPTIRLAQLAMLIHQSKQLFHTITVTDSCRDLIQFFNVTANDYWHYRYRFETVSSFQPKILGHATVVNIIINTVVPMLFAYGEFTTNESYKNKAINWLTELTAEDNRVIAGFKRLGITCSKAADSQALLQLKIAYCDRKRCLSCAVGNSLLKS